MHHESPELRPLVIGLDVGGTSSRARVGDLAGRTLGAGHAGGGNPNSHPPEQAVEQVARAARTALSGIDPGMVRRGLIGMAGQSKMTDPAVAGQFEQAWSMLGLDCPMRVVSDGEVAFAAGTDAPTGTVVIAGTGAIAARITEHRLTATSGGYGWLLGDEGSAFWMGREAARVALRALERGERDRDPLVAAVFARLLPGAGSGTEEPGLVRKRLITAVNAAPPIRLAELAPLVTNAARAECGSAAGIVRRAASLLADTAEATRHEDDTTPVVLAGSLLAEQEPVGAALREELVSRQRGEPRTAGSGEAGAAWLAALELLDVSPSPGRPEARQLHERFLQA